MEITTMTQAMQLHAHILKSGRDQNISSVQIHHTQQDLSKLFAFSALSPSGDLSYARLILNSLQTPTSYFYNTMIRAYSDSPNPNQAIDLFLAMHGKRLPSTPRPDKFTFPFVLKACSKLRRARLGKQLHGFVVKSGLCPDMYINNALIHMYSGCGVSDIALKVFENMLEKDVVSWTSIIDGLVDNDKPILAIELFEEMVETDTEFNEATIISVLRACADTGALSVGLKVHNFVKGKKISLNSKVSTAIIDMYAKCGHIDVAMDVFNETVNKDVVTWTVMIAGLASHGQCREAMELFEQMKSLKINPDDRTLTAVLLACRNAGWISEGLAIFRSMKKKYKVRPVTQHYGCIVDMLAWAGHLEDAEQFIRKGTSELDTVLWSTLISACKVQGDTARCERLIKDLQRLKMDPGNCERYALGNGHEFVGRWQEKAKITVLMNQRGLPKVVDHSRIEIDGKFHEFTVQDFGHVKAEKVKEKLEEIEEKLRGEGYDARISELSLETDNGEKEFQPLYHSEKLAVSFGIIQTNPGTTIRIVKNLRCCEDCHSFMELLSMVYHRDIIIRDCIRFHHFRNDGCSCGNKW